jgi:hypothetical protein
LEKPAVVLPVSLQEKMAEEKQQEQASQQQQGNKVVQELTTEQRKTVERKMRRASIAVGVMTAMSKQVIEVSGFDFSRRVNSTF